MTEERKPRAVPPDNDPILRPHAGQRQLLTGKGFVPDEVINVPLPGPPHAPGPPGSVFGFDPRPPYREPGPEIEPGVHDPGWFSHDPLVARAPRGPHVQNISDKDTLGGSSAASDAGYPQQISRMALLRGKHLHPAVREELTGGATHKVLKDGQFVSPDTTYGRPIFGDPQAAKKKIENDPTMEFTPAYPEPGPLIKPTPGVSPGSPLLRKIKDAPSTGNLGDFIRKTQRRQAQEKLSDQNLHGRDIVKKNEEYIAKHREAEYQREKADSKKKLDEAIWRNRFRDKHPLTLDETSRSWGDVANPQDFIEPGLEYRPKRNIDPDIAGDIAGQFQRGFNPDKLERSTPSDRLKEHITIHSRAHVI